jgi:adenylate cyclase
MTDNMEPTGFNPDADTLAPSELRVVLVCDVVESVRWMEQDEDNAVTRWQAFTQHVRNTIVPAHKGSVVKSTGDGLMLEFSKALNAVAAATAMQKLAVETGALQNAQSQMQLRIGIHQTKARRDAYDLYGQGVNLAARITNLAGPGEIFVTPEVRDYLTDCLDGEIEDMGECYLKHVSAPQRVYRVGEASAISQFSKKLLVHDKLSPTIAVLPFLNKSAHASLNAIGDLIADGVIARFTRSNALKVLSRYSTAPLQDAKFDVQTMKALLNADYVLRGDFTQQEQRVFVSFELATTTDGVVVFANRDKTDLSDLFEIDSSCCRSIAESVLNTIFDEELKQALTKPLPNLQSYTLYLSGVAALHRSTKFEHDHGEVALQHLIDRHPSSVEPAAWLAQWLAIKTNRGMVDDVKSVKARINTLLSRAIDIQPTNSFVHAIKGLSTAYFEQDFARAEDHYDTALGLNPNEYLGWLYKATLMAWTDRGGEAALAAEKAIELSPIHPMRYYIQSLAALPFVVAGRYDEAEALCKASLKSNKTHSSTYRLLACAQVLNGKTQDARETIGRMRKIEPSMNIDTFLARYPGKDSRFKAVYANALTVAGLT